MSAAPPPTMPEMPRDFMARCAQHGARVIFQYREELIGRLGHLRFIGYQFTSAEAARRWDDRPGNLAAWFAFPSWEKASAWMMDTTEEADGRAH